MPDNLGKNSTIVLTICQLNDTESGLMVNGTKGPVRNILSSLNGSLETYYGEVFFNLLQKE